MKYGMSKFKTAYRFYWLILRNFFQVIFKDFYVNFFRALPDRAQITSFWTIIIFFYLKIKKYPRTKLTWKHSLRDGPVKSIPIFDIEISYFKSTLKNLRALSIPPGSNEILFNNKLGRVYLHFLDFLIYQIYSISARILKITSIYRNIRHQN